MVRVEVGKKKTLIFTMGHHLSQHALKETQDYLGKQFPGYDIVVIGDCNGVTVIDPAEDLS